VRLAGGKITAMEFNAARQKQPHDFGGETARMHEDEILEAARRDHDAARASRRKRWQFWRRRNYEPRQ
jgi:hypothetical protein